MKFSQKLNEVMDRLSCTAKELCCRSGISPASLSRYRSGERVPELGSRTFGGLCAALGDIGGEKGIPEITADTVREAFLSCEDFVAADKEVLRQNFNALLAALNINLSRLCQFTNYDSSAIFRIRNGTRRPGNAGQFADAVAAFVARELSTPQEIAAVAELLGCQAETLSELPRRYAMLKSWLLERQEPDRNGGSVAQFLNKLDQFDLNEYIKVIHFEELKVPSVPFQLPTAKTYFGMEKMMESELDFLAATVLSKSMAPVTMYSDMPMKEMAKDPEFPKKWMLGMAMMLKKGLHLNQIHNIDRSFDEMMLGLESWIPMYMTGQISPYYFKNAQNNVFLHLLKVSGAAALSGEAIAGHHGDGRYYLTKSRREVEYYQKRAEEMLAGAYPLMDIYRSERAGEWNTFLLADVGKPGRRRGILSTLPLYTMSGELLEKILTNHGIDADKKERILDRAAVQRQRIREILQRETIEDEVPEAAPEELRRQPPTLELSGTFCETDIPYTPAEYEAHWREAEAFAEENPNYTLKRGGTHAFRNLQILIHEGQWVMISKGRAPAIHFVIRHPRLRSAIENFIPPVTEPAEGEW